MDSKTLSPKLFESCCTLGAALVELSAVKRKRDWKRVPWVTRWLLRTAKQVWQQAHAEKAEVVEVLETVDTYVTRIGPDLLTIKELYARAVQRRKP